MEWILNGLLPSYLSPPLLSPAPRLKRSMWRCMNKWINEFAHMDTCYRINEPHNQRPTSKEIANSTTSLQIDSKKCRLLRSPSRMSNVLNTKARRRIIVRHRETMRIKKLLVFQSDIPQRRSTARRKGREHEVYRVGGKDRKRWYTHTWMNQSDSFQ